MTNKPANEVNCFSNFQYNATGNSKINAYLLSLLVHYNYPTVLMNNNDENAAEVMALFQNENLFLQKLNNAIGHYFENERIISITNPNPANGYDPEAIIISTANYIIVVFRGTDRIAMNPAKPLLFEFANYHTGEWINTDFDGVKINGGFNMPGQVHRGFTRSLGTILPIIADSLRNLNVANKKLWITGHSLGGAHAQLCATYLKKGFQINPYGVYTYASPHVGDATFVAEMDRLFPGTQLQRFEFMNDPAPLLPLYSMGYRRAGIRNYYSKVTGANYFFNTTEVASDLQNLSAMFCFHNTEWYARSAYFELTDNNEAIKASIPNCPPLPLKSCNKDIDYRLANGETMTDIMASVTGDLLNRITRNITAAVQNITGNALPDGEGTYRIRCVQGGKTLGVAANCNYSDGCRFILRDDDGTNRMRFEVRKSGLGYSIKLKGTNKVLDVKDMSFDNGARMQLWGQHLIPVVPNNQIWYLLTAGTGNRFVLQNERSRKVLDADNPNTGNNGCEVMQWEYWQASQNQIWIFEKIN
jgi:hypothetical protein